MVLDEELDVKWLNTKGGASVPLASNAKAMEPAADPNFMQVYQADGTILG